METNEQEKEELIKRLAENPKIQKAMLGILTPLQKEGDSLTIEVEKE